MAATLQEAAEKIGAHVIAACPRDSDDACIVLAHIHGDHVQPYATWLFNESLGILVWGHYYTNEGNAKLDFIERTTDDH